MCGQRFCWRLSGDAFGCDCVCFWPIYVPSAHWCLGCYPPGLPPPPYPSIFPPPAPSPTTWLMPACLAPRPSQRQLASIGPGRSGPAAAIGPKGPMHRVQLPPAFAAVRHDGHATPIVHVCSARDRNPPPQGVELTHTNVLSIVASTIAFLHSVKIDLGPQDSYMGYLPLAHVFDRCVLRAAHMPGATPPFCDGCVSRVSQLAWNARCIISLSPSSAHCDQP